MAAGDVQAQLPAVFGDDEVGGATSGQPAGRLRQAFERTHAGVRALVQPRETGLGQQGFDDHAFPALDAAAGKLCHQRVGIAVNHQAGQTVRLAVHQAPTVTLDVKALPGPDRRSDARPEEGSVDTLGLDKTPDPGANFRTRAEGRPAEKLPVVPLDPHRFTGVRAATGNRTVKHPGMAPQQRTFLAFSQPY